VGYPQPPGICEINHKINKINLGRVAQFVSGPVYNTLIPTTKGNKNDSRT